MHAGGYGPLRAAPLVPAASSGRTPRAVLAAYAVLINLVPMLVEQGMSRNLAAVTLGLGGVGQVFGRLGYARLADATSVTVRTVSVSFAVAAATVALALAPATTGVLIALSMVLGLARGTYTLIQATAVTDRWGPAQYGALNGILTAPALVAAASASFVGAALPTCSAAMPPPSSPSPPSRASGPGWPLALPRDWRKRPTRVTRRRSPGISSLNHPLLPAGPRDRRPARAKTSIEELDMNIPPRPDQSPASAVAGPILSWPA